VSVRVFPETNQWAAGIRVIRGRSSLVVESRTRRTEMVRLRRAGLIVFATIFIVVIAAAYATEGLGLAVIAAIGMLVVVGLLVPVLAMFEEERDLPAERAKRSGAYRPPR
jgi:hypothetical protein